MANEAAEGAFENPLTPNAKLRQLYRAMLRMHLLGKALGPKRHGSETSGLEAALAATSVDLGPGDLVSDGFGTGVVEFLRGASLHSVLQPGARPRRGPMAECGSAARLPADLPAQDRIWIALGAAAGLKAISSGSKNADGHTTSSGVVVLYLQPEQVPTPLLRKALALASTEQLPVLFVAFRAAQPPKSGGLSAIALQHGLPGMAVDADDPVAIYRVAQESIGHARIGGGAALIECVPYVVQGAKNTRSDAISALEQYIVGRRVATRKWIQQETSTFAKRVAR